jgi:hypothetical protein
MASAFPVTLHKKRGSAFLQWAGGIEVFILRAVFTVPERLVRVGGVLGGVLDLGDPMQAGKLCSSPTQKLCSITLLWLIRIAGVQ